MFTERELKQFGYASLPEKIKKKQTGGAAGKGGYRYEDYFIVLKLAEATAPSAVGNRNRFRIQEGAFCPVDDVVVRDGQFDFFQLKTSPKINWSGKLLRDFETQIKLCTKKKMSCRLYLVVPKKVQARRLRSKLPSSIKQATNTIFFPVIKRRAELWRKSGPLYQSLCELCADPSTPPEALEALATAFEIAWRDCSSMGRFTALNRIIKSVHQKDDIPLRFDWSDSSPEWKQSEQVLKRISDLRFDTSRGFFCYSSAAGESGRFKCGTAAYKRFLSRVNKSNPTTFEQFMEIIP